MPELPEVETTRRGIAPHLEGHRLQGAVVRQPRLRYPVPARLGQHLRDREVRAVERRGKYLLIRLDTGNLLVHLGMSGSLRVVPAATPAGTHDHVDILFDDLVLRLHDPRRFGALLWIEDDPSAHPLLRDLGPEPYDASFSGDHLHRVATHRRSSVKSLIMNSHVVVGVGNIYASESLFVAGIHPKRRSDRISLTRYERLVEAIRQVLTAAIEQGGTTLRDFVREDGMPGYFSQSLDVYGRTGEICHRCGSTIRHCTLAQRSTYYCPACQR